MADKYYNKIIINGETKIDLTSDTVEVSKLLSGITAHDKSGAPITGTCTYDACTTDATAAASEILLNKTAYVTGNKVTGTMPNRGAVTGTISSLTPYIVPQGYHDGSGTVSIATEEASKIIASNIKSGISILGVVGEYSGEPVSIQSDKEATPSFASQTILPDSGYDYLSQIVVKEIQVSEVLNPQGGYTLTI